MARKDRGVTVSSFKDLAAHLKGRDRKKDLEEAIRLGRSAAGEGSALLLDHHQLNTEPAREKALYGWCYAQGAKEAVAKGNLTKAQDWLKKAITLGYHPWHVQRRLELVSQRVKVGEPAGVQDVERFNAWCKGCYPEPSPLTCAKCAGILREPCRPVYQKKVERLYSVGVYRWAGDPDSLNPLSRMIRWMKGNEGRLICVYLGYLMTEGLYQDTDLAAKVDFVVPVPADPVRRLERGFDNILELAANVEAQALLPLAKDLLMKIKATEDLRSLPWNMRGAALAGSMEVAAGRRGVLADATVLLIDDVVTSGTTLDMCAGLLLEAGAKNVLAATLARSESTQATERYS